MLWGGISGWPAEDPVVSSGRAGLGEGLPDTMVTEPPPQTGAGSAVLEPCARPRLGAACAPRSVWPRPSLCVVLTGTRMPASVSCTSMPAHTRSACTWPRPDTAVSGAVGASGLGSRRSPAGSADPSWLRVLQRPVETQCVPSGLCAQPGSVCVLGVSAPRPPPCAAVMVSPTAVRVSYGRLPASSRYNLRRPGQGPVSRVGSGSWREPWGANLGEDLWVNCPPSPQPSVAQEAPALGRMESVSRSCAGSVAGCGMRTQRTGHASATSAARVSSGAR